MTETQLAEAPIDATRVARLLASSAGVRVALVNLATGAEFFTVPLASRTRESVAAALGVVGQLRARLATPTPPSVPFAQRFGAGSAEELRPRPPSRLVGGPSAAYSFADKVETFARHIDRMDAISRAAEVARLRARGISEERLKAALDSLVSASIEEGRDYWYVRRNGSRRYAVDVKTGTIYPVASKGVLKYQGFASLDTIGEYDWNDRYYAHRKLPTPMLVEMRRSSLKSPEAKVKREPTYPLRTVDAVDHREVGAWMGWEKHPEKTKPRGRVIVGGGYYGDAWEGEKYSISMSMNDVVKGIRREFADDVASGFLPRGTTFSVTQRDGNHIRVTVTRVPGVQIVTREAALRPEGESSRADYYTRSAEMLLKYVESVLSAYNHDSSNSQMDYFNVKFYDTVEFSDVLELQQISDIRALERQGDRVDVYLTHSIDEALGAKKLRAWRVSAGPRAVVHGEGFYRIEWVKGDSLRERVMEPKGTIASEDVSSPAQVLEMAEGWAREFAKRNGRRR